MQDPSSNQAIANSQDSPTAWQSFDWGLTALLAVALFIGFFVWLYSAGSRNPFNLGFMIGIITSIAYAVGVLGAVAGLVFVSVILGRFLKSTAAAFVLTLVVAWSVTTGGCRLTLDALDWLGNNTAIVSSGSDSSSGRPQPSAPHTPAGAAETCVVVSGGGSPVLAAMAGSQASLELEERAREGDAFQFVSTDGAFHRIYGPSGEHRWIPVGNSTLKTVSTELPANDSLLRAAFRDIVAAEDRARALADTKFPPASLNSRTAIQLRADVENILKDELILQAMHRRGLNPILEDAISVRGVQLGWPMD